MQENNISIEAHAGMSVLQMTKCWTPIAKLHDVLEVERIDSANNAWKGT